MTEEKNDSKDNEDDDDGFLEELENEVGDVTCILLQDNDATMLDLHNFKADTLIPPNFK